VTSSIIPHLYILYPHMGPPTTSGSQVLHLLNPALGVHECVIQAVLPLRQCSLLHCTNISFSRHAIAQPCRHQRRNEGGGRRAQFPGRGVTMGAPNHCGRRRMAARGAEKSQECHKYFFQYSPFASERPQVSGDSRMKNVGGPLRVQWKN